MRHPKDPGEGYRWLELGEVKHEGDEFWGNSDEFWGNSEQWIATAEPGCRTARSGHYRRRISAPTECGSMTTETNNNQERNKTSMFITVAIEQVTPATASTPQKNTPIVEPETITLAQTSSQWDKEAIARVAAKHAEKINAVPATDTLTIYVKSAF